MITAWMRGRARRGRSPGALRRGAAVVELAVVTPILLTMLFGVMEFGWAFMVRETLTHATREACRVAVLQGATATEAQARFAQAIAPTGITTTAQVTYVDTDDPPDAVNDIAVVSVSVPYSDVSITGVGSFLGIQTTTINATCSMRIEGVN